ncbi:MAG TPA: glycosyltransferase family 39 protein [Bryobacteraceae bacterium]
MLSKTGLTPTATTSDSHSLFKKISCYVVLPLILIAASGVFRFVSVKKFPMLFDEEITRAVAGNIWQGNLSNNWKYAANIPDPFRVDCYNFSSYMYADALAVGPHAAHPLFRERTFSAILGTLAVILFYLVALRLFGLRVALAALAITSVFPLLVQDAHYARPEAFVTFLCGVVYLCSAMMLSSPRPIRWLAGASFCCGLMVASKVSLPPIAAVPLIALAARKALTKRSIGIWVALLIGGFLVGVPDAFLHPTAFWNGIEMLRHYYAGEHPPYSPLDSNYCFGLLSLYFWQTLGPFCCVLSLGGIAVLLWRRQYAYFAMIAAPVLFYFLYFGLQRLFFERNLSHIAPLIAILVGVGLSWLTGIGPRSVRFLAFTVILSIALLIPTCVSYKLVFIAMRTIPQERAKQYEEQITKREGLPIEHLRYFMTLVEVEHAISLAESSASDVIIAIYDYNDAYTRRARRILRRQIRTQEVGFFPSVFRGFSVSTLLTYHSPNIRYIRLFAPDSEVRGRQTFVSWRLARARLPVRPILMESWVKNGVYRDTPVPVQRDEFFGSYTPARGDANRGTLTIGPFDAQRQLAIGIPFVTGPTQHGLTIAVVNHKTGAVIAELKPPPNTPRWAIWRPHISPLKPTQIDVVAKDEGTGWGQWLAIGYPLRISEP